MFNLSVVNIVPDDHKDAVNQVAALMENGISLAQEEAI